MLLITLYAYYSRFHSPNKGHAQIYPNSLVLEEGRGNQNHMTMTENEHNEQPAAT